jgi:hypothetical protein
MDTPPKMTERDVVARLRTRYCTDHGNGPAAVLLPQVRNAAGFNANRTADALVMQLWPSRGLHLEGFEVKCSRADVLKELRDPSKAEAFARYCDRWWLVLADARHIKDGELPEPWGLLVCSGTKLRQIKAAPKLDAPDALPKTLLAAMLRQHDREMQRPTEAALRDRYELGVATGKAHADRAARDAAALAERVAEFERLTGLDIGNPHADLEGLATVAKLLVGDHWSSGLLRKIERLASSANECAEEMRAAGLHP